MMSIFNNLMYEQRMLTIIPGKLGQDDRTWFCPFLGRIRVIDRWAGHIELFAVVQADVGDIKHSYGNGRFNAE
jgi:hypothetical protein